MSSHTTALSAPGYKTRSVQTTMLLVMMALVPGTVLYALLIDQRIVVNLLIASFTAITVEYICVWLRRRDAKVVVLDASAVLAAWLLVLCIPPALPAWQIVLGVFVLVTLGKHVFGGLGSNPFNPAMVAYAFLLVSFPVTMTNWTLAPVIEMNSSTVSLNSESSQPPSQLTTKQSFEDWDGISGATLLDRLREIKNSDVLGRDSEISQNTESQRQTGSQIQTDEHSSDGNGNTDKTTLNLHEYKESVANKIVQSPWLWLSFAWLAGGLYLLYKRIISWHIPVSVLLSIITLYVLANTFGQSTLIPKFWSVHTGGLMLGAFFIATDPVSAATSRIGQLIYGAGIGIFAFVIREYSVYPEGFAFAVLLMNVCAPTIDHVILEYQANHNRRHV